MREVINELHYYVKSDPWHNAVPLRIWTLSCADATVASTEYTELQPLLSGVHSVMKVKLALADEGGGCTPTPFYYIYHHQ
jgi:hypothetical protein